MKTLNQYDYNDAEVCKFINYFKEAKDTFLYGCCYWFAHILCTRFPAAQMMYLPIENHFVTQVGERLYDARGNVTEMYRVSDIYKWEEYKAFDELHTERIIKYCINKGE